MKITIEQLGDTWLSIDDGEKSVTIVEAVSALDYHLALNALKIYGEMLNRHLQNKEVKNARPT